MDSDLCIGIIRAAVLIFMIGLILLIKLGKEWYTDDINEIDKLGSIIYTIFMGLFLYGIVKLDNTNFFVLIISFVFLFIFLKVEKNKKHPVYNLKLLKISNMF